MTVGPKILPVIEICIKRHDHEELDKLKGNIFVGVILLLNAIMKV
ncbi:MAG: hypothetical protein ACFFC9_16770 [Promethearchaeota archaeon]